MVDPVFPITKTNRPARRATLLLSILLFVAADAGLALVLPTGKRIPGDSQGSFRTESPYYHHDLRPNVIAPKVRWGYAPYSMYTNSLGFRDRAPRTISRVPTGRRLLLIGDSFTEGVGVDYEDSFAGLLDQELGRRGIDVLNAGVSSYAPSAYYAKVRHLLKTVGLRITDLAVFLDISDICDEAIYYRWEGDRLVMPYTMNDFDCLGRAPQQGTQTLMELGRRSLTMRLLGLATLQRRSIRAVKDPERDVWARSAWTSDERLFNLYARGGLDKAAASMDALSELLREHGVTLHLVVYPWPHQIFEQDLRSRHVDYWEAWARRRGHRFVDLFPSFINGEPGERVYTRNFIAGDVHLSRAGHEVVKDGFLRHFLADSTGSAGLAEATGPAPAGEAEAGDPRARRSPEAARSLR